jgi:hypothetical protein
VSRIRVLIAVAFAVAFAAAGAAGYVYGQTKAPDDAAATAVREDAAAGTFAVARIGAFGQGLSNGLDTGPVYGADAGAQRGRAQGLAAVQAATEPDRPTGGGGSSFDPQPLDGDGGVLVVGDSLEVLTSPYLKQYLPGVDLTVNAEGGYNSYQIFDLFRESFDPSMSVIVFDAGTNDNPGYPQILAGNLDRVASIVGPNRCLVVPSIHGLTVDGVGNAGKNVVVRDFVASRPGTQSPDWAAAVASHPELMQADDLHPIAAGADLRARLIARGVEACLAGGSF